MRSAPVTRAPTDGDIIFLSKRRAFATGTVVREEETQLCIRVVCIAIIHAFVKETIWNG